jgi:hypothetical protein
MRTYQRIKLEGGCYFLTVILAHRPGNDFIVQHVDTSRWRLIKSDFSGSIKTKEDISKSRQRNNERGIWQRRFWEPVIHDEENYVHPVEYIHFIVG